ncbi:MAG: hypothetical protein ACYC1U_11430 [Candidatus Aquicultorales bacterium]
MVETIKSKFSDKEFRNKALISALAIVVLAVSLGLVYSYYAPKKEIEDLYLQAERASQKGDLKLAEEKLREIIKKDPSQSKAKAELEEVGQKLAKGSQSPLVTTVLGPITGGSGTDQNSNGSGDQGPGTGGGSNGGANPGGSTMPSPSFESVLPDSVQGFILIDRVSSPLQEVRSYRPEDEKDPRILTVVAKNEGTGDRAKQYIDSTIKLAYGEGDKEILVGTKNVYFGNDVSGFAIMTWRVSGVVVAIEMQPWGKGGNLYDELYKVAVQFP